MIVHPYELRQQAAATFGLRGISEVFQWQKVNRRRLIREINAAVKPLGLRIRRERTGYVALEKIANRKV